MQDLFFKTTVTRLSMPLLLATALAILAGCSSGTTGTTTTPVAPSSAASLQLSGLPTTIKSDNSTTSTITVYAINANNAAVANAPVLLSADTGLLSASTATTDASGKATVTFSSGTANKATRIATITATSGGAAATTQVQIVGSTLALTATTSTVPANGTLPATLTVTAKDAGGGVIPNTTVTLTQAGSGTVTITPATGTTNASGQLQVTIAGATTGTATVTASAAGATSSASFTVGAGATTFGISQVTLNGGVGVVPVSPKNTAMQIGDSLAVQVSAPGGTANVTFATTIGTWVGAVTPPTILVVPVVGGVATATLTTNSAGVANVQVYDTATPTVNDTLTVGMTAKTPAKISLQASPTVIPRTVGSTVGFSNLTAMVYDTTGAPVGNAPVAFSIVSGTGTNSSETISPVVAFTAISTTGGLSLGAAPATFTAGSLSSGGQGVQVRASVVGTAISTVLIGGPASPTGSSYDVAIRIGGTAGSIAFGQAANIIDAGGVSTIYTFPMSVLVADSSGAPAPLGTVVNISAWPIAWTTGSRGGGCDPDLDGMVWGVVSAGPPIVYGYVAGNGGTFYNEDVNQNLFLDAGEDGTRKFFASGVVLGGGTSDGQITPQNSWGGTLASTKSSDLPGTATTDASGVATFNLTYTKSSAFWIITRIRAQTVVQGAPAAAMLDFRLVASAADSNPICYLPPSPFTF